MKDFLETLEIGENKTKLSKEEIKTILTEHGKSVTKETDKVRDEIVKENENLKTTIDDLKTQIEKSPKSDEMENLKNKIAEFEQKEIERKTHEEEIIKENTLLENISSVIGDKKFVNEFTKNAIINEIKSALKDESNLGKSTQELFESITKDKNDVFVNPNTVVDMPPFGDNNQNDNKKEIPILW